MPLAQVSEGHDMIITPPTLRRWSASRSEKRRSIGYTPRPRAIYVEQQLQPRGRVAKLVLIVPCLRHDAGIGSLPIEVFDGLRKASAGNRTQFYVDFASVPSTASIGRASSRSRPSFKWCGSHAGSAKAQYDGIRRSRRPTLHRGSEDDHGADARHASVMNDQIVRSPTRRPSLQSF